MRQTPANQGGTVNVDTLPQMLMSRVDIVTGGASAVYGSDAVAGVVNFILDKKFTGVKGEISGGVTTYGDDRGWKVELSGGTGFANERGHLLISGEVSSKDGIFGVPRAWNNNGWLIMNNPAYAAGNGQPQRLLVSGAGLSQAVWDKLEAQAEAVLADALTAATDVELPIVVAWLSGIPLATTLTGCGPGEPQPAGHAAEQGGALHVSSTAAGNWLPGAMSSAAASPARRAAALSSHQAKKSASPSNPYFTTSA